MALYINQSIHQSILFISNVLDHLLIQTLVDLAVHSVIRLLGKGRLRSKALAHLQLIGKEERRRGRWIKNCGRYN